MLGRISSSAQPERRESSGLRSAVRRSPRANPSRIPPPVTPVVAGASTDSRTTLPNLSSPPKMVKNDCDLFI